jgi:hypothetical protein
MFKFELIQTDKHATSNLLQPKNLRFLGRTNYSTKSLSKMAKNQQ